METVTMSYEELDRVSVIERVIEKRLTQRDAARMLVSVLEIHPSPLTI